MIPMPDPDCNKVRPVTPNVSVRCTMPEGHLEHCFQDAESVIHRHRRYVDTVTDVFPPAVGRHRRAPGLQTGPNHVDVELRRRLARAAVLA